jgi:hypothetical protein
VPDEQNDLEGNAHPEPAKSEPVPNETPAQEWGERHATGRVIQRGGKTDGHVPGAIEQQP